MFFLFPVGVLPFLYLIRKTGYEVLCLLFFGCSYYFIGYQIRHEYVMTLSQIPMVIKNWERIMMTCIKT